MAESLLAAFIIIYLIVVLGFPFVALFLVTRPDSWWD
jgi:hypothetical protein